MDQVELIRVNSDGNEKTIFLSPDQLSCVETMRQIAWHLSDFLNEEETSPSNPCRLNLNFKHIEHLNSEGLNELIGINQQARNHGVQLVLMDVQEPIRQVFKLTRLERMFEFSSLPVTA